MTRRKYWKSAVCTATRHDHFVLAPWKFGHGDLLAIDRAYIDIANFLDDLEKDWEKLL